MLNLPLKAFYREGQVTVPDFRIPTSGGLIKTCGLNSFSFRTEYFEKSLFPFPALNVKSKKLPVVGINRDRI